jgi:hypothetical protein
MKVVGKPVCALLCVAISSRVGLAQSTPIPSSWFSSDPKSVMSDPLFATLPLNTRMEILVQIDPKFAKMDFDRRDAFLWRAETTYLPKAAIPKEIFKWKPNDIASTTQVKDFGPITRTITARGLVVQASIDRISFLVSHVRIVNDSTETITVRPQIFVLEVLKPKRYTLFFEYPNRVIYQFVKAGINYTSPYVPTERTTVRSGTGRTVATVDSPDPMAKQDVRDVTTAISNAAFSVARTVVPKSLQEGVVLPGSSVEGDVYFERSDRAQDLVLKVFLSDLGFEIPFSLPKR